MMLDISSWSFG